MNITDKKFFCKAKPVWAKELSEQINCCIELECKLKYEPVTELYIIGATFFQVFINGNLIHYGPARVADGYAAVDIIDLSEKILDKNGDNILLIRAMGYNCPSFACVSHTSFVCAEVRTGNTIVAATGKTVFADTSIISILDTQRGIPIKDIFAKAGILQKREQNVNWSYWTVMLI